MGRILLVIFFTCFVGVVYCLKFGEENFKEEFRLGVKEFARTGHKNKAYRDVVDSVSIKHMFRMSHAPLLDPSLYCEICDSIVAGVLEDRRNGSSYDQIYEYIVSFCVNFDIESETVCRGLIEANMDIILYIADNRPDITSTRICSVVLQDSNCPSEVVPEWSVDIPPPTSEIPEPGLSASPPIKILHLSDIHYDANYAPGALATCGDPMCCQADLTATIPEEGAGLWGDYRSCDTPWNAIEDVLNRVKDSHNDVNFVYFTGDIISHKVWATSLENNTLHIQKVLQAMNTTFGTKKVYPILGNHEPHPLNVWVEDNAVPFSTQWVFDVSAIEWAEWLTPEAVDTIKIGGYYSVKDASGIRIIALNSNVCYTFNWWILFDENDPYDQLKWLVAELVKAEANNERVHLLSHIPSGSGGCLKSWAREFRRIVERFSGTIAAIFNGHTHNDEFVVYFQKDDPSKAVAVAYNGGSVTTYTDLNPNYKVYTADAESFEILDYDEYIYNLTLANQQTSPTWFKHYSFKEAFGLDRLRPSDVGQLVTTMATDQAKLDFYHRIRIKDADTSLALGCDLNCHLNNLCTIVANEYGDNIKCDELSALISPA